MEEHELKVKHIGRDREMVISKKLYHESPKEYEILEGDAGDGPVKQKFELPKFKQPTMVENKQDKEPVKEVKAPKAPKKPIAPPKA